jgi:adenine specific DNA methylase Mod
MGGIAMKEIDIIRQIPEIIENARLKLKDIIKDQKLRFNLERIKPLDDFIEDNLLYKDDNLNAMLDLLTKGYKGKIDLIYIDPPFFTRANYTHRIEVLDKDSRQAIEIIGYKDTWEQGISQYLEMLTLRLFLMRDLLSDQGSIYVHLDFRVVHYVKIIMDCIFGSDNFINEIIWAYKSGGTSNKYFSRKHDNILLYTKTKDYIFNPQKEKSYNRGFKPYRFKNVKEYEDDLGWYTLVNLKDIWQIDMVGRTSKERVGYRTQKPEALLERIILSSSREGSIVADFFSGSGTTSVVAEKNNRRWVSADLGDISTVIMRKRLAEIGTSQYIIMNSDDFVWENRLIYDLTTKEDKDYITYSFKFKGYIIDIHKLDLSDSERLRLERILETNSLSLVDYIGIGYMECENEIIIKYDESRTSNRLIIDTNLRVKLLKTKKAIIRLVDVFGQEYLQNVEA